MHSNQFADIDISKMVEIRTLFVYAKNDKLVGKQTEVKIEKYLCIYNIDEYGYLWIHTINIVDVNWTFVGHI